MRQRSAKMLAALVRAAAVSFTVVGSQELVLAGGLTLLTVGLWSLYGRAALIAPGVVLIWLALPQRSWLVSRTGELPLKRRMS